MVTVAEVDAVELATTVISWEPPPVVASWPASVAGQPVVVARGDLGALGVAVVGVGGGLVVVTAVAVVEAPVAVDEAPVVGVVRGAVVIGVVVSAEAVVLADSTGP